MAGEEDIAKLLSAVECTPLDIDDLFDVQTALLPVAAKWKCIGTGLRIDPGKLKQIEANNPKDTEACLLEVLTEWLNKNYNCKRFGEPSWRRVVEVVVNPAGGGSKGLAQSIAENHTSAQRAPENASDTTDHPLAAELKSNLAFLNRIASSDNGDVEESKDKIIRKNIHDLVKRAIQQGTSEEDVRTVLVQLYGKDLIINKTVYEHALEDLSAVVAMKARVVYSQDVAEDKQKPLFCEKTVYHASLCSLAVSTKDVSNYQAFFNTEIPYHCLEEVSLSRLHDDENIYRYLIAREEKTYYVAFQGVPLLSEWSKKFTSFAEGIQLQEERIPLRFFVRQMHDGYRIVFTGFSFGGLLALSLTAAMWKLPLLGSEVLKENLACITFGQPLLSLPSVVEVTKDSPDFGAVLHSVFMWDDCIPKLGMFLDLRVDKICSEMMSSELQYSFQQTIDSNFQGPVTSLLLSHLVALQEADLFQDIPISKDGDIATTLSNIKALLSMILQPLLDRNSFKRHVTLGNVYTLKLESTGLIWKQLQHAEALAELTLFSMDFLDSIELKMFENYKMAVFHQRILKTFVKELPNSSRYCPIPEIQLVAPSIQSVAFHRFGKEIAVTITGDNLWFCYQIQVGPFKQKVVANNISQKSIQFNYSPDDIANLAPDSDHVRVTLSNHFYSPVRKTNVAVKHKVYKFTFRQEQLAKLTPSELIEIAYMSTLLEQHPHNQLHTLSNRFKTLRHFLEQVVAVVPIESVYYVMKHCENSDILLACWNAFKMLDNKNTLFSQQSLSLFHPNRFLVPLEDKRKEIDLNTKERSKQLLKKIFGKKGQKLPLEYKRSPIHEATTTEVLQNYVQGTMVVEAIKEEAGNDISPELAKFNLSIDPDDVLSTDAVCGTKLQAIYSITGESTSPLKPPLQILSEGRQKLSWLAKQNNQSQHDDSTTKLSQLYNSKMLNIVNDIRAKELRICTLLLASFMEEQIRVPLMKSSLDTAKALNLVVSAAAVGVWAMFSLALGDMDIVLKSIPTRSLLVEIKEYIKGIFKEDTMIADQQYAGKLQFMVQAMKETVSCNSHYVSYSLECQLLELCNSLPVKIDESTPLDMLIQDWETIFKDNILSLVVPTHRSLIACWLKWALMVHNLREELAKYTAVGVVGLVNSGKSLLVSTLFDVKVPVGTTAIKRTTVPFLYNLDGCIDGLDVIDFPGVDDRDETIPDLAELLLSLAQLVVFVVDYRKVHTESAKKWLEMLEDKSVPVLVCLTYADKLYAEHMGTDGSHPDPIQFKQELDRECSMVVEQLGHVPSHEVKYFSFCQDRDSVLNSPDGRQCLKDAGIGSPQDVGDWLAGIFESQLDQDNLAQRLHSFVHREEKKPEHT